MPVSVQLVLSASDIGSAVAHRLKAAGYRPILLESPTPGATRRLMAFAGAVHAGEAELEGLRARRCDSAGEALALAGTSGVIPLLVGDPAAPPPLAPAVLVDARMHKRREPPVLIRAAPLAIGIGPGFRAGVHCHVAIESNWGERLGAVISEGASEAYTGRHRLVAGLGRERYLYAPRAGTFRSDREILAPVRAGEAVGWLDDLALRAEAEGILRGLAWSGLRVEAGAKVAEIDPTGDPANCRGIATRPARIAAGVLEAIGRFTAAA